MFVRCIQWVDRSVIRCKLWATEVDKTCTSWSDEGSKKCSEWADEGSNRCSEWADEGSKECSKWEKKCKWYTPWNCVIKWICTGWYWVSKWVCKAWYWVAKWVCKAWYWVAKWVCKAWAWVVKATCVVWGWLVRTFCWVVGRILCVLRAVVAGIGRLVLRRAPAAPQIEHVFVLMLENRSYDHMLGFAGLKGTDAVTGSPTEADGVDPAQHTNIDPDDGAVIPARTPAAFKLEGTMSEDPGHEFHHVVEQLAGAGAEYDPAVGYPAVDMSGFVAAHRERGSVDPPSIMNCYRPDQLPVITTLAREFAVCDRWFSSMPGPTWPNRFFVAAGSSAGLDDSPSTWELISNTAFDGYRFENGTIFDRLDGKCKDWKIYHGDELPVSFALAGMTVNRIADRFDDMGDFADHVNDPGFDASFVFIEPHYGNIMPWTSEDYTCGTSQHPLDDVTRGERLIKEVYEAIRNSPHWDRSLLIVTWDEHGGFYDHVEPPTTVAPGDLVGDPDNNQNDFDFTQLGVRVPAVVVSPLIERCVVDHTVYDHASIPATIERLFGLTSMTKRDAAANDVRHLVSRSTPRTDAPAALPEPARSGWRCTNDPRVEGDPPVIEDDGSVRDASDDTYAEQGDGVKSELPPHVSQAVFLAAMARIRSLRRWDVAGRIAVRDELDLITDESDARQFIAGGREAFRSRHGHAGWAVEPRRLTPVDD